MGQTLSEPVVEKVRGWPVVCRKLSESRDNGDMPIIWIFPRLFSSLICVIVQTRSDFRYGPVMNCFNWADIILIHAFSRFLMMVKMIELPLVSLLCKDGVSVWKMHMLPS